MLGVLFASRRLPAARPGTRFRVRLEIHHRFGLAYALLAATAATGGVAAALLLVTTPHRQHVAGACDAASAAWHASVTPRSVPTGGVLEVPVAGGLVSPLALSARGFDHPVYSPDGKRLALLTHSDGLKGRIAVCNLGRGETVQLPNGLTAGDFPLSWLPDGKSLVFLGGDVIGYGASQHPYLLNVDTRKTVELAGDAPWYWDTAVVSPDGKKLALLLQLKEAAGEPERLDVYDTRTKRLERIAGSSQFAEIDALSWSPDGHRIVFSAYKGNERGNLYVADVATKQVSLLLDAPQGQRDPAWSPDGRRIAFVRPAPGSPKQTSIWSVDLSTGRLTRLTAGHVDLAPSWSRDGTKVVFVRRG